jgi:cytochrome c556
MTLLEQVRFTIEWRQRNTPGVAVDPDVAINRMTPLELLMEISDALEEIAKEEDPYGMYEERRRHP